MRSNIRTNVASLWARCLRKPKSASQSRTAVAAARSALRCTPGAAARTNAIQEHESTATSSQFQ